MARFSNKIAIITGAASGIGLATAEIIAAEGGTVMGIDLEPGALVALASESPEFSARIHAQPSDVLDEFEAGRIVGETVAQYGRIDVLVNAVGGSTVIQRSDISIEDLSLDEWQRLVEFNLTGTFLYCNAVVPQMKQQGGGKIVNVSSIAGRGLGTVSSSAYAAAKGGIIALTRKLSLELGPFGIHCNAIAPGPTLTDRIKAVWEQRSEEQRQATLANIPLGRLPDAGHQARVIAFLASQDSDFVTGTTIDVAGGQR